MIGSFLAALLVTQAAGDQDAARLVPLTARDGGHGEYCTGDGHWCVTLIPGEDGPRPIVRAADAPPPPAAAEDESHSIWPSLILLKNGSFIAGVQARSSTGYSGGGGSATELRLFETYANGKPGVQAVFDQPMESALMIRACFGEQDMKKRRGACHDEYGFSARIGLAPGMAAGLPILTYTTKAWAFPRGASRSSDSTQMPPLRRYDLVQQADAKCSFIRRYSFDPEAGIYRPDQPLPECSDYTDP